MGSYPICENYYNVKATTPNNMMLYKWDIEHEEKTGQL